MTSVIRYKKITVALFFALLALSPLQADGLKLGSQAPDLIGVNALDGSRISLYRIMTKMEFQRDIRGRLRKENGKYVKKYKKYAAVLNFFSKSCVPCLREIPAFNAIAEQYRRKPVKFLYLNVDPHLTIGQIRRLADDYRIRIPILMVNQQEVLRKYDADVLPRLVMVDSSRRVHTIFVGFDRDFQKRLTAALNGLPGF